MTESFGTSNFQVHENQIIVDARQFQSWKIGLPEWVKNSSDAYERGAVDPRTRAIVVIFSESPRRSGPVFACLDFNGMSTEDLSTLSYYGDPDASGVGDRITGGHGNGGKLYAVGGFGGGVVWHTIKDGLASEYGLSQPRSPRFAFRLNAGGSEIRDVPSPDLGSHLDGWLSRIGTSMSDMPQQVQEAYRQASGCTLVVGSDPVNLGTGFEAVVAQALEGHPQMRTPLETANVFVMSRGRALNSSRPLLLQPIPPYEGFEGPKIVAIPTDLVDPLDSSPISTASNESDQGMLELRTSAQQMTSRSLRARHTVDFFDLSTIRGSEPVRDLVNRGQTTDRIYGKCELASLTNEFEAQLRGPLADAPLTRALRQWIGDQIIEFAAEIDEVARAQDRAERDSRLNDRLVQQMDMLNQWINRVVTEVIPGRGDDTDDEGGGGRGRPSGRLPAAEVGRLAISIDTDVAGTRVPVRFSTEFFGADRVTRVRPVPIRWISGDEDVAAYSPVTKMINTYSPGHSPVWCETDGGLRSNEIELQVIDCAEVEVEEELVVRIGEKKKLIAAGIMADGSRFDNIRLFWSSDDENVNVGPAGFVTGIEEGTATVIAREGDGTQASCLVSIVPSEDGTGGPRHPTYLLSEEQTAPYDTDPPRFHKDEGLILQRADVPDVEYNIWWINKASTLARFIVSERGVESEEWFLYLVERMADAAIEASFLATDQGLESRPLNDVLYEMAGLRSQILESFMEEFGQTNQLVL